MRASQKRRLGEGLVLRLSGVGFDVFDGLPDRADLLGGLVRDLDAELLFEGHDQFDDVQGIRAEVIGEARFQGDLSAPGSGTLGRAYALAGRRADAERIATIQWRPIPQAGIFMALGDKHRALESLERAIPLGPVRLGRALTDPEFASLRGHPRVKSLRKKLGLPE